MKNAKKKNGAVKGKGRAALSAQQTIPYLSMHPDGVCKLPGGLYTKTVEYEDINYSVASTEDQTAIFSGWSSFLNYFDSSLPFQLSFINRRSHSRSRYQVNIPKADDNYNSVRDEFTGMLKNQIAKSNNGIERSKYITFGIPAEGIAEARPRLERVEADVMGNFKRLGVPSEPMDGRARLALLHSQMHPGSREAFRFSWKDIPQTGLGTKDFIAPDSLDFRQSRTFRIGQYWGAVSYLQIMASELSDKLLAEILELDAEMTVTMHIQTVDQLKAIKTIKGKISDIGKMKVEEQRKAVRSGYDPDILPPDLITFSKDAAELLADLQSRNERMFLLTFTVVNLAPTRQRLENDVFTVGGIAQKYNCALRRLDWQQEQGFVSSLALGYNEVEIQRGMTTSSTAIFIPFMTRELRMAGQALYYGMNALSHNVIMADRKKLKSANGMYLGSTGSGKSFAAKRELLNVFLTIPQDRIIVVDPMGEYAPLVRRLGGQVIEIAPDSPHHLNPMDVELNMAAGESPLSMKADFLLSLCELVVGGKEGLQPIEKTVIDRCVRLVYREQALGLETAKTPLLQDLYEELLRQPEPEARRVATALELYCTGSLNLFNHPTNVKTDSRVVCIVLKNMGENLRKIAMHITNEFVSQAVDQNFHEGAATWCYFDEFHILLRTSSTAIFIPFMTRELRMAGQALYYGMNALSHNVIMADRKKLKSANGMYLGSTGSGKSFAAKRELLNVFLTIPQDRIIVVDPMGEYAPLVRRLGGQVIEIAPDSPHHLNPMDVELNMAAGESPLSMKADFLLSLCELVVGGKEGLQPIEKTVIDRCVRLVYREQALGLETAKTPLLQDLYEELLRQPEPEARRVATALELYCTGSLNLFNHPTNVKTDSRVVCIVLKNMGENLRKIAMHITNEFVSQAVDQNFHEGAATWCYFDEFHILLRDPLTASYFVAVWKMLRKKGCVPSALTQNVKDLLASREIENILDNTDFMILLSQAQSDRTILAKQLGISEHQLSYITHSNSGEGLLFYGNVTIPFVDRFPRGEIYDLLTTRPEDMKNETKNE